MIDYIKELVQPVDPELAEAIFLEKNRQNSKIELIASENFTSTVAFAAVWTHEVLNYTGALPEQPVYNIEPVSSPWRDYAAEQILGADTVAMSVAPSGTIRDTYAKGNITTENVYNSFSLGIGEDEIPGYPLISVYLTGEELKLVAKAWQPVIDNAGTVEIAMGVGVGSVADSGFPCG